LIRGWRRLTGRPGLAAVGCSGCERGWCGVVSGTGTGPDKTDDVRGASTTGGATELSCVLPAWGESTASVRWTSSLSVDVVRARTWPESSSSALIGRVAAVASVVTNLSMYPCRGALRERGLSVALESSAASIPLAHLGLVRVAVARRAHRGHFGQHRRVESGEREKETGSGRSRALKWDHGHCTRAQALLSGG